LVRTSFFNRKEISSNFHGVGSYISLVTLPNVCYLLPEICFQVFFFNFLNLQSGGGIKVHSTLRPLNGLLCQPWVIMIDNGEICGMIGRGNRSTRRKPAPVPVCPPQTPHAARTRTQAAAVGSQRLTAELQHGPLKVLIISLHYHRWHLFSLVLKLSGLLYAWFLITAFVYTHWKHSLI
jgi:hypothetical protein